ncbi:MAG: aminopeptidase, partial [Methanobacteriota archaeon]
MSLMDGARRAVNECMGVQKGEKVLVLTDTEKEPIGRAIFAAADEAGADPFLTVMKPRSRHGEEPPEAIAAIMRATDVVIAPTAKSVSHTQARRKACEAGVRVATMPGINEFIMEKGAMTADFRAIAARIAKVGVFLEGSKKARVTTALGTDITFGLEGRRWVLDDTGICHKKGGFTNLPAGEVFIAPLEGTTSGTLVVDGAMPETLDRPIRLTFEKGTVTKIEGG